MLQTIVCPNKENFDMQVSLPAEYIGKEVHVLFYIDDEVQNATASILPTKKPSDFFGTLSPEEGEKMQAYISCAPVVGQIIKKNKLSGTLAGNVWCDGWVSKGSSKGGGIAN